MVAVSIVLAIAPNFEKLLSEAFDLIRRNAEGNVSVMSRMLGTLETIASLTANLRRRRRSKGRVYVRYRTELSGRSAYKDGLRIGGCPHSDSQERKHMKTIFSIGMLAALATAQSLGYAQTTKAPAQKPIVQTTCKDYLAMDEVVKPKFIYYTVGHSKQGDPTSATFDVVGVDKLKPVIDEYCRSHLTASAYQKVMDESKASEKTNK